jgi:hypothetical protein
MTTRTPPPSGPAWLALSGLAPYLALAPAIAFSSDDLAPTLITALIAYAGIVQGFTGGVRWGAELARAPAHPDLARLAIAGLITIPAWTAILLALAPVSLPLLAMALLAATGVGQLFWDLAAARAGLLPGWTYRLRTTLTAMALACLIFAALRLM